jgi:hypothetical protein
MTVIPAAGLRRSSPANPPEADPCPCATET